MPRRKSKPEEKPEAPVEVPTPQEVKPEIQLTTTSQPTQPITSPATEGFTIKEVTWEEFEKFTSSPRKERSKSKLRQAFEMAASGKVMKLEGLTPAQVRAILAAVSNWNYREKEMTGRAPVQAKYDMKAGVVYLAPAEKPKEKKQ
jgi:hypothetical protein